ncbi:restriction endonuclease subunit S [Lactococcus garvieae]|uniref:restriction endonuclease subunit S n=1 Tax=Lactococcus garvieae TaxID=1363 RepID=UPI000266E136|nr:restriction endonuclease subunit S [Lactococcus garvieae]EIT66511.1 Type I site-specific deoxyribonuclease [Lactococcus garvieae IPLA 31405]
MKERLKAPELRFPGFTDDWEERKVKDIFKITRGQVLAATETSEEKSDISPFPVYSSQTKNNGLMGYYKDYLFDTAITWTTDGANAGTVRYRSGRFYSTNVNGVLISDKGYTNKAISEILNLEAWKWVSHVGNPKLMNNVMGDISIMIPSSFEEQDRLSDFLNQLDDTIALHQHKLDLLKEQKKGYLQKMFPKNGAKVPELRFAGFADDWEERKFQWLIDQNIIDSPIDGNHGEKHPKSSDYVESGIPFLMAKDIKNNKVDIKNCTFISKETAGALDKGFAKNGDILLTHKATIGEVGILEGVNTEYAMLTPQITYYRILDFSRLDRNFFSSVLRSSVFQKNIHKIAKQSTRPYVGITEQRKLTIYFPIKIEEQQKIGSFFAQLDNTIALHQRKLDLLKEQKKGFLQKMFV